MTKKIFKITAMLSVIFLVACSSNNNMDNKKVIRIAEYPDDYSERQREYEERRSLQESTKWGQAETKPWDERYKDHADPYTYQGNVK